MGKGKHGCTSSANSRINLHTTGIVHSFMLSADVPVLVAFTIRQYHILEFLHHFLSASIHEVQSPLVIWLFVLMLRRKSASTRSWVYYIEH